MSRAARPRRRIGEILHGQTPLLLIIVAVALGLMGEGASKLIDALMLAEQSAWVGLVTFLAGLVLLAATAYAGDLWARARRLVAGAETDAPAVRFTETVRRRRGLVVLVSSGTDPPAKAAVAYHGADGTLGHCWLIAGPGEGEFSSHTNAHWIKAAWEPKGVDVSILDLDKAFDAQEVYRKAQTIYEVARVHHGLSTEDLIADYTGGTKPMSVGLVLATVARGIDLQYMEALQQDAQGRALDGTQSIPQGIDVGFMEPQAAGESTLHVA